MGDAADVAVVGGGLVGLAAAWELARAGARVTVLERHDGVGREQSTHNSQVVHSGAFVRPGTERAALAREGNRRLYEVAAELGVRAERCGTLVVAVTPDELPRLAQYRAWGEANGVPGSETLSPAGARRLEPHVGPMEGALWLPSGGRVDAPALVDRLAARLRAEGTRIELGWPVVAARRPGARWLLSAADGRTVEATAVVNAAGVASATVAAWLGAPGYRIYPCLGEYARVKGAKRSWVTTMVYGFPPSGHPGIGVHLTRRVDGELLLGPTATYLPTPDVPAVPLTPLATFAEEARRLVPGLDADDLEAAPAGVRAKPVAPGAPEPFGEFVVRAEPAGARAFQLVGIESPGLTASFAIGARVAAWYRGLGAEDGPPAS